MTKKQIKKIAIINAVCIWFAFVVIRSLLEIQHSSYAAWIWGPLGYWIMKKKLLLPEDDSDANNIDNEDCESNTANDNNVAKTNVGSLKTNNVSFEVRNIQTVSFCRKCGNKLIPNSIFCNKCGFKIDKF